MDDIELMQELAKLYLEIRELKERISVLESARKVDGKPVLSGTPAYVRNFIEARNKLKGDNNG
jgi:uncharacterized protein (UPF0297 family)